jgi:hypothetical protein
MTEIAFQSLAMRYMIAVIIKCSNEHIISN